MKKRKAEATLNENGEITVKCSKCGIFRKLADYHVNLLGSFGVRKDCKECIKKYHADKKELDPIGTRIALKNTNLMRNYNITIEEYNKLLEEQEGKCAICDKLMVEPHLDHDHSTGKIRALLCQQCNMGIGMFGDDPDLVVKAAAYLKSKREA